MSAGSVHLRDLRVDSRSSAVGIDSERPVFSWRVSGVSEQWAPIAAQITVGDRRGTPIWDSGEQAVGDFPRLVYGGPALDSLTRFSWKIRATFRTGDGRVETADESDSFVTGIRDDAGWRRAAWIGPVATADRGAPLLRREFVAPETPLASATLVIAAGGFANADLNGAPVSPDVLSPGFTDYDRRVHYVVTDVTDQIRAGSNTLGLELGRGFYGLTNPNVWSWQKAPWHAEPCVRALLRLETASGEVTDVVTGPDWETARGAILLDDLYGGERFDARRAEALTDIGAGPDGGSGDDLRHRVIAVPGPHGRLVAQPQQPIRVTEELRPVEVVERAPGVFVAKFARVIAGWLRISVVGEPGDTVHLRYGEVLRPDGSPNYDDEKNYFDDDFQHDVVTLAGGALTWESRFSYKGFQYVEITGWPGSARPSLDDLTACVVHTDARETSTFDASEPLLSRLHRITVDTMLNNLHGLPTDTPKFEKNGWTGDGMVGADMFLTNLDSAVLLEKWVQDIADTRPNGGPPALIAPNAGYFGVDEQAPVWHAAFVLVAWDIYRHTGDASLLERHRDDFADYLRFELSRSPGGIADTILGDWCSPTTDPGGANAPEDARVTATAFLYRMLTVMSEIDAVLGDEGQSASWRATAETVRLAFVAAFVDEAAGVVRGEGDYGFRQTHALLTLAFDIVPDGELARSIARGLADDVARRGDHLDTGAVGTKYLLPILTRFGHVETAWRIATQRTFPSWGFWLDNGATSLWEHWKPESRSRGHYFLGTVDDWLTGDVAGLRPAAPGWREIEVRPALTEQLEHASASVETPFGRAAVSWRRCEEFVVAVTVPVGSTALVTMPSGDVVWLETGEHMLAEPSAPTSRRG